MRLTHLKSCLAAAAAVNIIKLITLMQLKQASVKYEMELATS